MSKIANVDPALADSVAAGLGFATPAPMPHVLEQEVKPEVQKSKALSLFFRPGETGAKTRRVAVLIADGVDGAAAMEAHRAIADAGAIPRLVSVRLEKVTGSNGGVLHAEAAFENMPSVLFDGVVIPGGGAAKVLASLEFPRSCSPARPTRGSLQAPRWHRLWPRSRRTGTSSGRPTPRWS